MSPIGPTTSDQPTFTLNKMASFKNIGNIGYRWHQMSFGSFCTKSLFVFVCFCFVLFVCLFVSFRLVFRTNGACN